jgi:SAM-dependent methyltransferase
MWRRKVLRRSRMGSMRSREHNIHLSNRLGAKQDWQACDEQPALDLLLEHGQFAEATSVVEFGCGTGQLAQQLLST